MRNLQCILLLTVLFGCQGATRTGEAEGKQKDQDAKGGGPPRREIGISAALFSPDSSILVTLDTGWNLRVWAVETRKQVWIGQVKGAHIAQFFADGRRVALGCHLGLDAGREGSILIWDIESHQTLFTLGQHAYELGSVQIERDERHVVSAERGGGAAGLPIKLWNVEKRSLERDLQGKGNTQLLCMTISQDATKVLLVVSQPFITAEPVLLNHITVVNGESLVSGPIPSAKVARFLPDAKRVVVGHNWPAEVCVYSVPDLKKLTLLGKHETTVQALAVVPDGKMVLSTDAKELKFWMIEPPKLVHSVMLPKGDARVSVIGISPNGKLAAVGGHKPDTSGQFSAKSSEPTLSLFDVESGKMLAPLLGQ